MSSWLIRPRELYFNYYNTYIHGITAEDVKDKPQFNELWNDFKLFFEGKTVIAHNASFDMGVLRRLLDEYGIPYPELHYFCTRVLAKKVWPTLNIFDILLTHSGYMQEWWNTLLSPIVETHCYASLQHGKK